MDDTAATGFIGVTDPEWYQFLLSQERLDEVNFWMPHGNRSFKALRPGEPFFFKLRGSQRAVVGFGFFRRFEMVPAWLAWDLFGTANGAPDRQSFLERLAAIRRTEDALTRNTANFDIGCIILSAPVLFEQQDWVSLPGSWAKTGIQVGKRYSLMEGEGEVLWSECQNRALARSGYWNVDLVGEASPRYGNLTTIQPRLGQGIFSLEVRSAYGNACAVTGEHSTPVLDAAHIIPFADGGEHRVSNGLLLRSDIHRLYDRGYVTVDPDLRFEVSPDLRREFSNGKVYYELAGTKIRTPELAVLRPDPAALEWHYETIYRAS